MDRNELKIQALLEKVSSLTMQYENQVADLRVELTLLKEASEKKIEELEAMHVPAQAEDEATDESN